MRAIIYATLIGPPPRANGDEYFLSRAFQTRENEAEEAKTK